MLTTLLKCLSAFSPHRLLTLIVAAILLGSCRDATPTGLPATAATPALGTGADQGWVRSSAFIDVIYFVECLGEDVRFFGDVAFQVHEVTSASGSVGFHVQVRPITPHGPPFVGVGQTSGRVFQAKPGQPILEMAHLAAGEVRHLVQNEVYVAEGGDRFLASAELHLTVNANGVVTVSRFEPYAFTCVDR